MASGTGGRETRHGPPSLFFVLIWSWLLIVGLCRNVSAAAEQDDQGYDQETANAAGATGAAGASGEDN